MSVLHDGGWPWVRTQIHPQAHKVADQVHRYTRWTFPQLYAAAIHKFFMGRDPDDVIEELYTAARQPQPPEQPTQE